MYLIDRPDGLCVRYDGVTYSIRQGDLVIREFAETRERKISQARKNAERLIRKHKLGIVTPQS